MLMTAPHTRMQARISRTCVCGGFSLSLSLHSVLVFCVCDGTMMIIKAAAAPAEKHCAQGIEQEQKKKDKERERRAIREENGDDDERN